MKIKQVIIMRKDLNMRKGKMVSQGCHGSVKALIKAVENPDNHSLINEWLTYNGRKVCVGVDSLDELLLIHNSARDAGLVSYLVQDIGLTEFKSPTFTCVCIGPHEDKKIDAITGSLKLL